MEEHRPERAPDAMARTPREYVSSLPETVRRLAARLMSISPGRSWVRAAVTHIPFAVIFVLAVALLTIHVNTPWSTVHEDNGLVFEVAAINHIRFGLGFTKGQDFFDTSVEPWTHATGSFDPKGVSSAAEFQYFLTGPTHPILYGDHPPLLGLTIAGSLLVFGYHFWAVRLVPIVFTLGALVLFYRLMLLLFNTRTAAFASALFITFPIAAYYGRDVAHEAPTLCCEIGMALCYALWRRGGDARWLWGVAGCVALGMAYGWPMLFFAWLLPALDFLATRRLNWRLALATAVTVTLTFGLVLAQIAWAAGGSLSGLTGMFFIRSSSSVPALKAAGVLGWIKKVIIFNVHDFGKWTAFALLAALIFLGWRLLREGLSLRLQITALFALGGLAHIIVFREGSFIHDYWQFYLIPFYALALGWSGVELVQWLISRVGMKQSRDAIVMQSMTLAGLAVVAFELAWPWIYHLQTNLGF